MENDVILFISNVDIAQSKSQHCLQKVNRDGKVKVDYIFMLFMLIEPALEKISNIQVGLNLGFTCFFFFFVKFSLESKLGKNAKYRILIYKLDFLLTKTGKWEKTLTGKGITQLDNIMFTNLYFHKSRYGFTSLHVCILQIANCELSNPGLD